MPIRKSELHKYPPRKIWQMIRACVLRRAKYACEFCGVPNHEIILSERGKRPENWYRASGTGESEMLDGIKTTRIVLTTAHLDHDPTNNDGFKETGEVKPERESNLRALCQRCHNHHDRDHRQVNAAETRARKNRKREDAQGQRRLFDR